MPKESSIQITRLITAYLETLTTIQINKSLNNKIKYSQVSDSSLITNNRSNKATHYNNRIN